MNVWYLCGQTDNSAAEQGVCKHPCHFPALPSEYQFWEEMPGMSKAPKMAAELVLGHEKGGSHREKIKDLGGGV